MRTKKGGLPDVENMLFLLGVRGIKAVLYEPGKESLAEG